MAEARESPSRRGRQSERRRRPVEHLQHRRKRRLALTVIGVLLLAIVGIVVAGYVVIFVMPPRQLLVKVDDAEYTRGDLVKLLRVQQEAASRTGNPFNAADEIFESFNRLVEEEIIAQTAPSLGITASEEEVEAEIRRILMPSASQSAGKDSNQIEREFQERYSSYLNAIQIDKADHEKLMKTIILRGKMTRFIGDSVSAVAEHVNLYRIAIGQRQDIELIYRKYEDLVDGRTEPEAFREAFQQIAREFSQDDQETLRKGGELGWFPRGVVTDYEFAFFDLDAGELSDPIPDVEAPAGGLFVFMIAERDPARELVAATLRVLRGQALQDWLNEERKKHDVHVVFNDRVHSWMVKQLRLAADTPTPAPAAPQLGF